MEVISDTGSSGDNYSPIEQHEKSDQCGSNQNAEKVEAMAIL
jgi:hypothetical protein